MRATSSADPVWGGFELVVLSCSVFGLLNSWVSFSVALTVSFFLMIWSAAMI